MYDEPAEQDKFIRIVGGMKRADRLQYIWNDSHPHSTSNIFKPITKADDFRQRALREGFTSKQTEAFLKLR